MGQVSDLPYDLLHKVLRYNYGISSDIILPIDIGISDTTYHIIDFSGRSYFAKLYEASSLPRVFYELRVLDYLRSHNFPIAALVSRLDVVSFDNLSSFVSSVCGKPFCVFDFIEGYSPNFVSSFHIEFLARFLANFHNLSLSVGFDSFRDYLLCDSFDLLRSNIFSVSFCKDEEALSIFSPFLDDILCFDYSSEDGLIHGDIFPDNVHFNDNILCGVFDFSFSCVGSFYFDLGVVISSWCMDGSYFSHSLFNIFIDTYREYYLGDICYNKLFNWLKFSILFFALQRYSMEKFRGCSDLNGRTYREYISKLISLNNVEKLAGQDS